MARRAAGLADCVVTYTWREELAQLTKFGLTGAFAGLKPRIAMTSCMTAVQFAMYDTVCRTLTPKPGGAATKRRADNKATAR